MVNNNTLVDEHVGLVSKMARQLMKKNANCDWLTEDDLIGAGHEALVKASHTYDAKHNASFKTYASTCIKNAMLAEIRNMFPIKVYDSHLRTGLVRSDETDGTAELHELAELLGRRDFEQRRLTETVMELMSHLSPDERWLIRCYYGFDGDAMTLQGIADLLSVSPQAVHKRLTRVHDKLRRLVMDSRPCYRMCA